MIVLADDLTTWIQLVERLEALEQRGVKIEDLPLAALRNKLIEGGEPIDGKTVLGLRSVATDNLADKSVNAYKIGTVPHAHVYRTTTQSITSGTPAAIGFDAEEFDNVPPGLSQQHDNATNNTRLTCQLAGLYWVHAHWRYANNTAGTRYWELRKNGGTTIVDSEMGTGANFFNGIPVGTHIRLVVGDYIEAWANQTSGGALNVHGAGRDDAYMGWHWVCP